MENKPFETDHKGILEAFGDMFEVTEEMKREHENYLAHKKSTKSFLVSDNKTTYNAFELFNLKKVELPKLVNPFFQTSGLASLVGESDSGKSTFLRQLSINIALKEDNFLGFKLNAKHHKVLYVSTEDNADSISFSIQKQIQILFPNIEKDRLTLLKNLEYEFNSENLIDNLTKRLKSNPVDLLVIDSFTDVFTKELNSNTQVRNFLNAYDKIARDNKCLIIFLHHINKRSEAKQVSKNNIIGSQGFEAKMRCVLQLKQRSSKSPIRDLWILKSNFLDNSFKSKSYVLDFSSNFGFTNTGINATNHSESKSNNKELLDKILEFKEQKLSYRAIEEKLTGTKFQTGKSTIQKIYTEYLKSKKRAK